MLHRTRTLLLAPALLALAACADTDPSRIVVPDASLARQTFPEAPAGSIVDVALAVNAQSGEFSTLIAALGAADPAILALLDATGQRTVFAPTDAAFAAIGYDKTNIGAVPRAALSNILRYHVANGERLAADVVSSKQIRMLNGGFTTPSLSGANAFINGQPIERTDIVTTNGVIHIIGGVLLP